MRNKVKDKVKYKLRDKVKKKLRGKVKNKLRDKVKNKLGNKVKNQLKRQFNLTFVLPRTSLKFQSLIKFQRNGFILRNKNSKRQANITPNVSPKIRLFISFHRMT